jgi:hypothetical protein
MNNELIQTIPAPEELTIADWKVIADIRSYKTSWVFDTWAKAKGEKHLKSIDIDSWLAIANFLGKTKSWAIERYDEYRNGTQETESQAA